MTSKSTKKDDAIIDADAGATKIYTKGGDRGQTSLVGGERVSKADSRLEAYGTADELNCVIGLLLEEVKVDLKANASERDRLIDELAAIQNDLFDLGSHLACADAKMREKLPQVTEVRVQALEAEMDRFSRELKPLKNFVLPGGAKSSSVAHLARTVCRRAERAAVQLSLQEAGAVEDISIRYLNRLSDYFFVFARHCNRLLGVDEPIWGGKARR